MSSHAKLTGVHHYVEFNEETIQGRVKEMVEMRGEVDVENPHNLPTSRPVWKGELVPSGIWCGGDCSACAVKDEGCWSLKPGERILFEAH